MTLLKIRPVYGMPCRILLQPRRPASLRRRYETAEVKK